MHHRDDAGMTEPAPRARGRRGIPSGARRLAVAGVATLGVLAAAGPAHAALSATGPIDPVTLFPAWYEDADHTQLQLCLADPGCPASPALADFTAPDGEAFYQLASATMTDGTHTATIDFNIEAAFLGSTPQDGITFGRLQLTLDGMQPSSEYTVTHPYGVTTWTSGAKGALRGRDRAGAREEKGCGNTPCNFDIALTTSMGPFLQWDPAVLPAAPTGYIGDGATEHAVIGSPTGDNFVRIEGPGLPPGGLTTNLFTVEGKYASAPQPVFFNAPGSGAFGTVRVKTTATRRVVVKNNGLADMDLGNVSIAGDDAADFATGADTCAGATIASGETCSIDVSLTPAATGARMADLVIAQSGGTPDHVVALTGTGGEAGISASPGIMNFLNQNVSTTSGEEHLTLRNTGAVSMTVTGAAISGPDAGEFALTSNACTTPTAVGATCTIGLRFLPAAAGVRNATLTLSSDAPGGPVTVPLTGNGTVPPGPGEPGGGGTSTAGGGAGAPGAAAGAGAGAAASTTGASASRKPLVLRRLGMAKTIKRATARRQGLRLHMELLPGTEVVKINVYRRSHGRLILLSSGLRTPGKIGLYKVRQRHPALRRLLKVGVYEVHVTPGRSRTDLGTSSKFAFRVT
ncbi:MAG: hypothetical protein QOD69_1659 [Solirubrobacteraceae bacterium]|nr:hypothetical protein [Solirubrobacteraceae bacterium]